LVRAARTRGDESQTLGMKRKFRDLGADRMNSNEELSFRLAIREQAFGDIEQALKEATDQERRKVCAPRRRSKND
jgi:hypothetical protein